MNTIVQSFPEGGKFSATARRALVEKIFDDIRALSIDGPGVSRESYGPGETAAMDSRHDYLPAPDRHGRYHR